MPPVSSGPHGWLKYQCNDCHTYRNMSVAISSLTRRRSRSDTTRGVIRCKRFINCATCSSRGCEYTGHSCLSGFPLQEVLSTCLMAGEPSVDETSAPSHRPTGPRSCFVEVGGMSWSIFPCFSFSARGPWAAIVLEHEVTVIDSSFTGHRSTFPVGMSARQLATLLSRWWKTRGVVGCTSPSR